MHLSEVFQLLAEQEFPVGRHHLIQWAGCLQVVGELKGPGSAHPFTSTADWIHPSKLVPDVGLSSVLEPGDGVAQWQNCAVGGPSCTHLFQDPQDVIHYAVLAVIQKAEMGEGVIKTEHWNLDVGDGAVKLVGEKQSGYTECQASMMLLSKMHFHHKFAI